MLIHLIISNVMFYVVQGKVEGYVGAEDGIQGWKKEAEEWEDKAKKNEEAVGKLVKKREQYKGDTMTV